MKLTPDFLRTVEPDPARRIELRDDDEPGLVLRVTPNGAKSWSVRYVAAGGEHRRQPLGRFPDIPLARARLLARKAKGKVAEKIDTVGETREAKAKIERQRIERLDVLAESYFADCARGTHKPRARAKAPRSIAEDRAYWERDVKPAFGSRPVPAITRKEIIAFVDKMTRRSPSAGRHCHTLLRQLMSYAVMKEIIPANPALNVATVQPEPRTRFLTDDELRTLWPALVAGSGKLSPEMCLLMRMLIVTPLRVSEVAGMRWDEIDRKRRLWTVPASRMKGKRIHAMPLSPAALDILDEARSVIGDATFVFASSRTRLPMGADTVGTALDRLTGRLKISGIVPHDFRRTAATNITGERIGTPRFIVKQVLAHADRDMTGMHYDMNDYLVEKRRALEAWAQLLEEIVGGKQRPTNVVSIAG